MSNAGREATQGQRQEDAVRSTSRGQRRLRPLGQHRQLLAAQILACPRVGASQMAWSWVTSVSLKPGRAQPPGNTAFGRGGRKWRISCPGRGRRAFEPSGCRLCRSRSQVVIEILLTSPAPSRAAGCSCPVRCVLFPATFSKYE